jgi:hypothetical protein
VVLYPTKTTLTSAPNPSTVGQAVTFKATGTVSFYRGATLIGTSTLSGGVATLTTSTITVGSHSIAADYSGSSTDARSPVFVLDGDPPHPPVQRAGVMDQQTHHHMRSKCQERILVIAVDAAAAMNQLKVQLVHQRRRLPGVIRPLAFHLRGCQAAKLRPQQLRQRPGGFPVARRSSAISCSMFPSFDCGPTATLL